MLNRTLFINFGKIEIILIYTIVLTTIIYSFWLVLKNEKGSSRILWILVFLIVPFISSIIYILFRLTNLKKYNNIASVSKRG